MISKEAMGQFVTPTNKPAIPQATAREVGKPKIWAKRFPKVAPIKRDGRTSPPLNPEPIQSAVRSIFIKNAYHTTSPSTALSITGIPAPRKSFVPRSIFITIKIIPPIKIWT